MILSLFGPDGVGKSTVTDSLSGLGWKTFSGTSVDSWPDQTWHRQFVGQGIDESQVDSDQHFLEKIKRLHRMAHELEPTNSVVVIDSDPLHKTLMYDYVRALPDVGAGRAKMKRRYDKLTNLAGYHDSRAMVHVYFQVAATGDDDAQAKVIHDRLQKRPGKLNYFDPKNLEQSTNLVKACRELKALLEANGQNIITVTTDGSFELAGFLRAVQKFQKTTSV